jgi:hypothetical protein
MDQARSWHSGLFFIARTLFSGFFPWSLLFIPAFFTAILKLPVWRKSNQILPMLWFLSFFVGLIFFKNKFQWYVLPLYPPACIVLGNYLASLGSNSRTIGIFVSGLILFLGVLIFVPNFFFNPFLFVDVEIEMNILNLSPYWKTGVWIYAGLILIWFLLLRYFPRRARVVLVAILVSYSIFFVCLPLRFAGNKSEVDMLVDDVANIATEPKNTLYLWNIPIQTFLQRMDPTWESAIIARWYFYSIPRTRLYFLSANEKELNTLLQEGGNKIFLIPEDEYDQFKLRVPHHFVTSRKVKDRRYVLIRPLEEAERMKS